jgi:hypothetical protein
MGGSIFGSKYKLTEAAEVTKISAYLHTATGSDASTAIYTDSNGPYALQAESNTITLSSWDWYDFSLSTTLSPGDYWLFVRCDSCYFRNSTGENNQWARRWDPGYLPDPFGSVVGWSDYNMSIYAIYTSQ